MPPIPEENSKSGKEERLLRAEAELTKHGFTTNDLVMIPGRLRARVNGAILTLGDHAFSLLLLLAQWAISAPGEAFAVDAVIREIERSQERLGKLGLSWVNPTKDQVHKAASELRSAIRKARRNALVFESVKGQGYRLNTPAGNVHVDPAIEISVEVHRSLNTKKLTTREL